MAFNAGAALVECPFCIDTLRVSMQTKSHTVEDGALGLTIEATPAALELVKDHLRGHLTATDLP